MSALGHKRTFAVQKGMSALPPISDIDCVFRMSALGRKRTRHYPFYIGGAIPLSASNVPSASFFAPGINTGAFGFNSLRSPEARLTTLLLGVVVTTFVPPLYSTVKLFASTLLT